MLRSDKEKREGARVCERERGNERAAINFCTIIELYRLAAALSMPNVLWWLAATEPDCMHALRMIFVDEFRSDANHVLSEWPH